MLHNGLSTQLSLTGFMSDPATYSCQPLAHIWSPSDEQQKICRTDKLSRNVSDGQQIFQTYGSPRCTFILFSFHFCQLQRGGTSFQPRGGAVRGGRDAQRVLSYQQMPSAASVIACTGGLTLLLLCSTHFGFRGQRVSASFANLALRTPS